ncbi:hypothetical protein R1flu_009180 [Riccia fluitans]|uniref:Uncharacterized protein n=1 Tax=Riccia fluitans TaxID=41844 RepID=A0ABD1Z1C1_9MARC
MCVIVLSCELAFSFRSKAVPGSAQNIRINPGGKSGRPRWEVKWKREYSRVEACGFSKVERGGSGFRRGGKLDRSGWQVEWKWGTSRLLRDSNRIEACIGGARIGVEMGLDGVLESQQKTCEDLKDCLVEAGATIAACEAKLKQNDEEIAALKE